MASRVRTESARKKAVDPDASVPRNKTINMPTAWLGRMTVASSKPGCATSPPRSAASGVPVRAQGFHSGRW